MVTLGQTLAISGHRITGSGQTFVCCWVVESTIPPPPGLLDPEPRPERVVYRVDSAGLPVASGTIATRSVVAPNFSAYPSRMPGSPSGMSPVECYSAVLDMDLLPVGTLYVYATAYGLDGTSKVLETFTIENDRDGVDRRPSSAVVYWDYDSGSDGNGGTGWGDAVATLNRAIQLAKVGTNCGGAQILARGDIKGNGGAAISGVWETGALHWLTITADSGATWSRINPPFSTNSGGHDDNITCNAAGGFCRVRLQGFWIQGTGPIFNAGSTGSVIRVWREGCKWGSVYWDGAMSVLCHEDDNDCIGMKPETATTTVHRSYVTGELRQGGKNGWNNEGLVFDCYAQGTMGGSTYIQGSQQSCMFHTIVSTEHSYTRNVTRGWADSDEGTDLEIQATGGVGGVARILGPVGGVPFGAQAAELAGAARTGICIFGFPTAANGHGSPGNPTGLFQVVGGGITGGRNYCDYINPAAVSESGTASANLETGCRNTSNGVQVYNQYIHTSYLSVGSGRDGEDILRDIANFDIDDETQTVFNNLHSHNRLLIDNCRSGGGFSNVVLSTDTNTRFITNSIIRRCSFTGSTLQTHATLIDYTGTVIENCVFNSIGAGAVGAISNGLTIRYCHTIGGAGPAGATDHTTGTWLAGDPTTTPFSMEPTAGNKGTGDPHMLNTELWAWDASTSTKGATKAVALLDWATGTGTTPDIDATGSMTSSASVSAQAALGVEATAAVSASAAVSGSYGLGIGGTGAMTGTCSVFAFGSLESVDTPVMGATTRDQVRAFVCSAGLQVTPSDSVPIRVNTDGRVAISDGFYVGNGGDVVAVMVDGSTVTMTVPGGTYVPLRVQRINATGTTASGLMAGF